MSAPIDFLRGSRYFTGLSTSELESIAGLLSRETFPKGEVIAWEGDPCKALYLMSSGAVKCFKTSDEGKEQILRIAFPGDSFNDVAAFDRGPNTASAEAMTPVELYQIAQSDMHVILGQYPEVLRNALGILTERIRHLLELVEDLSFRRVANRIARMLLEYAGDGSGPHPRLTQQEMAAVVGSAREVVGRSLKTLQDEGAIRMERNRIVITNKETLKEMADALA